MIHTHGLTHISLAVRDPERSLAFYATVFGVEEYYRDDDSLPAKGPGMNDVGFRLVSPEEIDDAVEAVVAAGGTLLRRGEFAPGFPYAYVSDPDGYEIEIWFE